MKVEGKKSMWKPEEDLLLKTYVETHGEGKWNSVSKKLGLRRDGKSCRLRWKNYLRPDIKRERMSKDEEDLILRMHKLLGNRWSLIAGRLPGRTDNEVKNYWNTHLSNNKTQRSKKKQTTTNLDIHKIPNRKRPKVARFDQSGNDHDHHRSTQERPIAPMDAHQQESNHNELKEEEHWSTVARQLLMEPDLEDFNCDFMDQPWERRWDHTSYDLFDALETEWEMLLP